MKTDLLRQGIRQSAWRGGVGAAMLLAASAAGAVHADGKWLDSAPQRWNNPGGWVPSAPKGDNLDRCGTQERQPAADEESQLAAANWRLQNFWPMQTNGKVSIVTATASYDGMCRPWQFNAFVFYDHKFAGTISPSNMDSRLDSVLRSTPTAMPDGSVRAEFTRYAASDPLCCPSLGTTTVSYRIEGAPNTPYAVVEGITSQAPAAPTTPATPAAPQTPSQLPRTGEAAPTLPTALAAVAGSAALLLGAALRFGRKPPARLGRDR